MMQQQHVICQHLYVLFGTYTGSISITIYPQLNQGHTGTFGTLTKISSK